MEGRLQLVRVEHCRQMCGIQRCMPTSKNNESSMLRMLQVYRDLPVFLFVAPLPGHVEVFRRRHVCSTPIQWPTCPPLTVQVENFLFSCQWNGTLTQIRPMAGAMRFNA